jgi:hypothetical protein
MQMICPRHGIKCQETLFRIDLSVGNPKDVKESEEIVDLQLHDMTVSNVPSNLRACGRAAAVAIPRTSPAHLYCFENSQFELIKIGLQKINQNFVFWGVYIFYVCYESFSKIAAPRLAQLNTFVVQKIPWLPHLHPWLRGNVDAKRY